MQKISCILFFLFFATIANAQFISDAATNKPYYSAPADILGSPFLNSNWSTGVIKTVNGAEYKNLQFRYDIYKGELVFNINDSMYLFNEPVKEFILHQPSSASSAEVTFVRSSIINNQLPGVFVQEIAKGKASLYKHYKKIVIELASYGGSSSKMFEDKISYYIIVNNQFRSIPLSKKALEEALKDKWHLVNSYMEQNKLNAKSEAGWAAAIRYYNSL